MNNIENMINSVLSNPEQMKMVMDVAGSIMGNAPPPEELNAKAENAAAGTADSGSTMSAGMGAGKGGGLNLGNILSGLTNLPGGLAGAASSLLNSSAGNKDKTELLEAMKPWLSEKRRSRIDGAMKIARVMKTAGEAFFGRGQT